MAPVIVEEASTGNLPQLHLQGHERIKTSRVFQVSISGPRDLDRLTADPLGFLQTAILDALHREREEPAPSIQDAIDYQQGAV